MRTFVCEGSGAFYSSVKLTFVSWRRRSFLVGEILINTCILRDLFLIEIPVFRVNCGVEDISLYRPSWRPSKDILDLSTMQLFTILESVYLASVY